MVLLRQFYEPNAKGDDKLRAYSLQCEKSRLIGHGEVVKCDHFVKIDSKETGRVCGLVEQDLPRHCPLLDIPSPRDPVPVWTDLTAGVSFSELKPQANFGEGDFSELNLIFRRK
jgi:hypothetical protein